MRLLRRAKPAPPVVDIHPGYRRSPQNDVACRMGPVVSNKRGIIREARNDVAQCWVPDWYCRHDKQPKYCEECNA